MKKLILNIMLCLLALPSWATIWPMNGGNLRRENHSLAPSSITNPLKEKWIAAACSNSGIPAGGPVVLNDRVIQCFTHGVRCVNRLNGNQMWLLPTDVELYATPTYDPDRNVLYVCRMDGSTLCLSVDTGEVLWYFYEYNSSGLGMYCSPVYVNNTLIVGNGAEGLACLNPDTHQVIWRFYFPDHFRDAVGTPAYDNGHLYFSSRTGRLFCLNASDGTVDWSILEKCVRQNSFLLSDDYIFSMGQAGRLACLSRTDGKKDRGILRRQPGHLRNHADRTGGFLARLWVGHIHRPDVLVHPVDRELPAQFTHRDLREGLYLGLPRRLLWVGRQDRKNRMAVLPRSGIHLCGLGRSGRKSFRGLPRRPDFLL
jgi:outer membrane protein assembly factor BamB